MNGLQLLLNLLFLYIVYLQPFLSCLYRNIGKHLNEYNIYLNKCNAFYIANFVRLATIQTENKKQKTHFIIKLMVDR